MLAKVFREICTSFGWRFKKVIGLAEQVPTDADVVLFILSLIDLSQVTTPYIGMHVIRDPKDVIVSGYLYHMRCSEDWCINENPDATEPILFPNLPWSEQHKPEEWKRIYLDSLRDKSYQQILLEKNESDGLLFELYHYGFWTIQSMLEWDYNNPVVREIRFESIMSNYDETFREIFEYFDFSKTQIRRALLIAAREDLSRKSKRQLRANPHISSPNTTKWAEYFTQSHKDTFKDHFGDALSRLGYEKDEQW